MNYTFKIYTIASELKHTAWSTLSKRDPFYEISYLQEIEKTCYPDLVPYYVIAYLDDEPILALSFQKVQFNGSQLKAFLSDKDNTTWIKRIGSSLLTTITDSIRIPMLVLGNLLQTSHCGIIFSDRYLEDEVKVQLIQKACDEVLQYTRVKTLLITNIYDDQSNCLAKIPTSYNKFFSEPDMHLSIQSEWNTMEDYLASLHSKYRVRAKKVYADSRNITMRRLEIEEVKKYEMQMFALNREVMKHSKFSLGDIHPNYFTDMVNYFKNDMIVNAYFDQQNLVAFSTLIKDANTINSHFIGMDYTYVQNAKVYNRILFDNLAIAIEKKVSLLKYGRTATEIKSTLGAIPKPMVNYLKSNNPIVNRFIKIGLEYMKAPSFTIRHPFKK